MPKSPFLHTECTQIIHSFELTFYFCQNSIIQCLVTKCNLSINQNFLRIVCKDNETDKR